MADPDLEVELRHLTGSAQEARWLLAHVEATVPHSEVQTAALSLGARRRDGEPLQYLLGEWPFRSLLLEVDPRALIPRPETEQLVEVLLRRWRRSTRVADQLVIVDLGTGTGAIGLSLATELREEVPEQLVVLSDRSEPALELAARNAVRAGQAEAVVAAGDWFEALDPALRGAVDLLASNPPYVDRSAEGSLAVELSFEPASSLFSDEGSDGTLGFADVERIIEGALEWMAPGGLMGLEMAEHQVDAALAMASRAGFVRAEAFEDLAGKPRGITASAPGGSGDPGS